MVFRMQTDDTAEGDGMTEKQRAERILANLTAVNEDLLALVNDVGHSINCNDKASRPLCGPA